MLILFFLLFIYICKYFMDKSCYFLYDVKKLFDVIVF